MELYIARNKNKHIYLYFLKPKKLENKDCFCSLWGSIHMNKKAFPNVTWENSPKKVRIELVE